MGAGGGHEAEPALGVQKRALWGMGNNVMEGAWAPEGPCGAELFTCPGLTRLLLAMR